MNGVAVGFNRRSSNASVHVGFVMRFLKCDCSALNCLTERDVSVAHFQGDVADSVSMFLKVIACRMFRVQGSRDHEVGFALCQCVGSCVAIPCLQPAICNLRKAETRSIVIRRLLRVPYPELNMMNAL